jgi:hypothetical protein
MSRPAPVPSLSYLGQSPHSIPGVAPILQWLHFDGRNYNVVTMDAKTAAAYSEAHKADFRPTAPPSQPFRDWLDGPQFYALAQDYRHAYAGTQLAVVATFDRMRDAIAAKAYLSYAGESMP